MKKVAVKIEKGRDGDILTHPTFGLVSLTRTSCTSAALVGSEITHNSYISLTIQRGELHREYMEDWWLGSNELIKINITADQFTTLITSMGGQPTPCTIARILNAEKQEGYKVPKFNLGEILKTEMDVEFIDAKEKSDSLNEKMKELLNEKKPITKTQLRELASEVFSVTNFLSSNMSFFRKQVTRAVEKTVTRSKAHLESWVQGVVGKLGLKSIQSLREVDVKADAQLISTKEVKR